MYIQTCLLLDRGAIEVGVLQGVGGGALDTDYFS